MSDTTKQPATPILGSPTTVVDPVTENTHPSSVTAPVSDLTDDVIASPVVHAESLTQIELEPKTSPIRDPAPLPADIPLEENIPLSADLTEAELYMSTPSDYKTSDEAPEDEDTFPSSADLTEASIYELLSPRPPVQSSDPEPKPLVALTSRNSMAESDFEHIDESRFSTVALNIGDKRDSTASIGSSRKTSKTHKRNSSSASFLLARVQDSQFRTSVDGQQILQEEFNRVQETEEDQAETTAAAVDWSAPFPLLHIIVLTR